MVQQPPSVEDAAVEVGVIIVTYNSADHLDDLLASLEPALTGVRYRLVVVDNDSSDGTADRLESMGVEVVRMPRNVGYSGGINAGLRVLSSAGSVLLLNPDIKLEPGAIPRLLIELQDPSVGIVVPQTREFSGELSHNQRRDPSLLRAFGAALFGGQHTRALSGLSEFVGDPELYLMARDIDWGVGAVMLLSRACLDDVGGWDESFFLYSEETDYCQRARRAGFSVRYVPDAVAFHEGGGGVYDPRLRSMMIVNKVRLYGRSHSLVVTSLFFAVTLVNEVTRAAIGNKAAAAAARSLLFPSRRPPEIKCSDSLLPR